MTADATRILDELAKLVEERYQVVTLLERKQSELQEFVDSLEQGPAETLKLYHEIMEEEARKQDKENRKLALHYFIYGALVSLLGTGVGILITFLHH